MITLTEEAKKKVVEFMKSEEKEGLALRLTAHHRGPRRFAYELNLEETAEKKPAMPIRT